jgi:hypothetical protein
LVSRHGPQGNGVHHVQTGPITRLRLIWCRRGDLNPHGDHPPPPQDGVSTNSTTSAISMLFTTLIQRPLPSFLRLWQGGLGLNRNLLPFHRSCLSWSFPHHSGGSFCRSKGQEKRSDHKDYSGDRRQLGKKSHCASTSEEGLTRSSKSCPHLCSLSCLKEDNQDECETD